MHTQHELRAEVQRVFELALATFPLFAAKNPAPPTVTFFMKGTNAGTCVQRVYGTEIRLNMTMASTSENIFKLTIPHEVAHMVCQVASAYGRNHNHVWKVICMTLGGDGRRSYAKGERGDVIPGRRTKQYRYENQNGAETWVGPVHHKRLQTNSGYGVRNRLGQKWDGKDYTYQHRIKGT